VRLERVADLVTAAPAQPGRPAHVAAASGLVRSGDRLVVAVDDENALATFALDGGDGAWVALGGAPLPLERAARKAAKADVESLALLPDGTVLALGSGATRARERAWRWTPGRDPEPLELAALYARLHERIPDLNLEGAAWLDGSLLLAQRGNGARGTNALVRVDLERERVEEVVPVALGAVAGVELTLSDLDPLPQGRLGFAASAEDVRSTYDDGAVVGAAVGVLDAASGAVEALEPLPRAVKVEGICGDLLVADADDDAHPSPLLKMLR
jgi:hypothetical protein